MGVGGKFWELLKPYVRNEDVDFLRDKRVAVDLSFWIVQHETAIRSRNPRARNPHLRNTFFRTIALFSKMGAYPVFVVDGDPSPLKSKARIERFFRMSGLELSELPKPAEDERVATPVKQRNRFFTECVRNCMELLELLGMPVLQARGEAEALCAQLNIEGHVDACITADSDAFLFGAKCVIKSLKSNSKEPFECYDISEVEAGLGLRRKQMIAISLLVGNDHGLDGIPGIGIDTATRFVQLYKEDDILDRLLAIGKGNANVVNGITKLSSSNMVSTNVRSPHCSKCGHPGSKSAHLKIACEHCVAGGTHYCMKKPSGFKCSCSNCDEVRKTKEHQKHESWQLKVCKSISGQLKFPNNEIIALYLNNNHGYYDRQDGPLLKWGKPKVEELIDFLNFYQHWDPSYVRQRMLPMLCTIYLREMASTQDASLMLCEQYKFHSIMRVKIVHGHPYYLVKWKRAAMGTILHTVSSEQSETQQIQLLDPDESTDQLGEQDLPTILVDDGCCFLLTDENMELVRAAFPKEDSRFLEEKEGKRPIKPETASPKSSGVQLSITQFYRSSKVSVQAKPGDDPEKDSCDGQSPGDKRKKSADLDKRKKPVRRRLLFD